MQRVPKILSHGIHKSNPISVTQRSFLNWWKGASRNAKGEGKDNSMQQNQKEREPLAVNSKQESAARTNALGIPGVKHIVAVASGKGGVGKSTLAANLALALSSGCQQRVGLLDADIYGPSVHRMMNLSGKPDVNQETRKLIPLSNYGVKCMSMGFIVQEDAPTIWRGPMVMSAVEQMLRQVEWGELDCLVLDLPPGTGDVHLTISQRISLSGAVVVSTPQDIALIDARRAVNMFRKVHIPILGIVENMSYFKCGNCGEVSYIFGHAGARETAKEMDLPFLGDVPLHIDIRTTSDSGRPIVVSHPESEYSRPYLEIARQVLDKLEQANQQQDQGPRIIIE